MKNNLKNLHRLFIFSILSLTSLISCNHQENSKKKEIAIDVVTEIVVSKTIPAVFSFVGFTQSSHEVEIRARVEGYLETVDFKEGSFVKEGDLLYTLDKKPFEAAVQNAKGDLAKQKAILWNAKKSLERLEPLFEQKAASRKDLDSATADDLRAKAELQSAKARLIQAQINLNYTTIKSPISGLAADTHYKPGALITPGANALLTTISIVDPIWVYFSVSENERLKLKKEEKENQLIIPEDDLEIQLVLADGSIFPQKGKVNFASPSIDQKTGTMSVRASLPNPNSTLMPGQFVRINVLGALRQNAIVIPQKAVLEGKNGMFVYVAIDGKAAIRNLEVGDWYENGWIIKSGLKDGDLVIVEGVNKLSPGTLLNILKTDNK